MIISTTKARLHKVLQLVTILFYHSLLHHCYRPRLDRRGSSSSSLLSLCPLSFLLLLVVGVFDEGVAVVEDVDNRAAAFPFSSFSFFPELLLVNSSSFSTVTVGSLAFFFPPLAVAVVVMNMVNPYRGSNKD